jgi:hypothetical protein
VDSKLIKSFTAFANSRKVASGSLRDVAQKVKKTLPKEDLAGVLIFDDETSALVEIDFRGSVEAVVGRLVVDRLDEEDEKKAGPGRPKLGVVSKEVTLLPHHCSWLGLQPGGASVTLRKLVEEAKKKNFAKDRIRQAQEAAYKFMTVMAGDLAGFEEALRALYAKDSEGFAKRIKPWPKDIRDHAAKLASGAF